MNTALKARLKHARKNTKLGKKLARHTKKFRKSTYWMKPRVLKK